jgi:FAD/FMN-containing dehydrogenase
MKRYQSWGRYPVAEHTAIHPVYWQGDLPRLDSLPDPVLPFAYGRSYGDSCLNEGGILIDTEPLSRFIEMDEERGLLRCEAGVSLADILELIVPRGWFLPVVPGTRYVSVGGAIANDIHGKNHHRAGTFGRYVRRFELLRSNGDRGICSPEENEEMYRATIGGLGLTGLILWAELNIKRIVSPMIEMERIRFSNLDEFFEVSSSSDQDYEHTMAWIDCVTRGEQLGRGIFMRGNFSEDPTPLRTGSGLIPDVPIEFPNFALNRLSVKAFNTVYYNAQRSKRVVKQVHYEPFFFPLDAVNNWNRIYGKRGFMQYQCVVPSTDSGAAIREIVRRIAHSGHASFLAVLKEFGDITSPGMLSFPRPGVTLALDFPNQGEEVFSLFDDLDSLVREAGGVLYPAKDARMSARDFQSFYPQWKEFAQYMDPHFSSSFWRRVTVPVAEHVEVQHA